MGKEYRYILLKGSRKYHCPICGEKRFVPFVDTLTGELLPEQYGRCDREIKCAYYLNPYIDGYANKIREQESGQDTTLLNKNEYYQRQVQAIIPEHEKPAFFPVEIFKQSLSCYDQNNFVLWLNKLFDTNIVDEIINRYYIGTSKHWDGATVFWQIDEVGNIRSGKIMVYNQVSGNRIKEPENRISWAHKALKLPDFNLKQCYFGTHLLNNNLKPVGLVESEKTAIICSIYLPKLTWLAVGSLNNMSAEKCKVLAGRSVFLFPDLNGFDYWNKKAEELKVLMPDTRFQVSDLLERNATDAERIDGLDLADYLIRFNLQNFKELNPIISPINNKPIKPDLNGEKREKGEA